MRQRAFARPVPIKTNLSVKAGLHEDKVQPLPLTPLTPRTELELRRSCRTLLSTPAQTPYADSPATTTKYQHAPSNAAYSFHQTTSKIDKLNSPTATDTKDKLELLRHLYEKPHPPPPPPLADPVSPLSPTFVFTPAVAKKFSVCDLRTSSLKGDGSNPTGTPILLRRPTLIDVSSNRPKTADMRTRKVLDRINQVSTGEKEKLGLFPARPSTSHTERAGAFKIDLADRPLPPLPVGLKPVRRSHSDNEVVLGKPGKESKGLRGLRKQISVWFGRKKNESAAVAA